MFKIFNLSKEELKNRNALNTALEIYQQPEVWGKTVKLIKGLKDELSEFLKNILNENNLDIIFTGAGSSEFIGNALFPYLNNLTGFRIKSFGTTDIVSSPESYISKDNSTLLISFARSGNSPESVAAVEMVEKVNRRLYNIFITCNKDGKLANYGREKDNTFVIVLPEETHDSGFAMTSSVTSMFLAALMIFRLEELDYLEEDVASASEAVKYLLNEEINEIIEAITEYPFDRIVYLGSGGLKGIAEESALKMMELTAGKVVSRHDSPMGFRHGPKSILNNKTLTVIYLSKDEYTRKYEVDLLKEMSSERKGNKIMILSHKEEKEVKALCDYFYSFNNTESISQELLAVEYVTIAQSIAICKALSLNITPDNPSPTGIVNRVVKGVNIYSYDK